MDYPRTYLDEVVKKAFEKTDKEIVIYPEHDQAITDLKSLIKQFELNTFNLETATPFEKLLTQAFAENPYSTWLALWESKVAEETMAANAVRVAAEAAADTGKLTVVDPESDLGAGGITDDGAGLISDSDNFPG